MPILHKNQIQNCYDEGQSINCYLMIWGTGLFINKITLCFVAEKKLL